MPPAPAVLAAGFGTCSSPEVAAGLGVAAGLILLPPITRRVRSHRYGDVAVGLIVLVLAVTTFVRAGAGALLEPATGAAFAVALVGLAAGRVFGRAAAVWAAALVALRYEWDAPVGVAEPWLVAWTGVWMALSAPRIQGLRTVLFTGVACGAPLFVALVLAVGPWSPPTGPVGPAAAIVLTLMLLPASALAGAILPGAAARAAGAAAIGVLVFSLVGDDAEVRTDVDSDRPVIADSGPAGPSPR